MKKNAFKDFFIVYYVWRALVYNFHSSISSSLLKCNYWNMNLMCINKILIHKENKLLSRPKCCATLIHDTWYTEVMKQSLYFFLFPCFTLKIVFREKKSFRFNTKAQKRTFLNLADKVALVFYSLSLLHPERIF